MLFIIASPPPIFPILALLPIRHKSRHFMTLLTLSSKDKYHTHAPEAINLQQSQLKEDLDYKHFIMSQRGWKTEKKPLW